MTTVSTKSGRIIKVVSREEEKSTLADSCGRIAQVRRWSAVCPGRRHRSWTKESGDIWAVRLLIDGSD